MSATIACDRYPTDDGSRELVILDGAHGSRLLVDRREKDGGDPRHQQPQHVGQVMAGVGEQCRGVRNRAVAGLDDNERCIQPNSDCEGAAETRRRMTVAGMAVTSGAVRFVIVLMVRMIVVRMVVMTVGVAHAPSRSTRRWRRRPFSSAFIAMIFYNVTCRICLRGDGRVAVADRASPVRTLRPR